MYVRLYHGSNAEVRIPEILVWLVDRKSVV